VLTIGSLFTGIGGIDLGLEWAGLGPVVWQCERDPYCREVLARHWPGVPIHEDVERLPSLPYVDLVCGGFPCQDVSSAGKGAGLEGARSGLWYAFAGVVSRVRPRFVVVENVASGAKRWLPQVRRSLHVLGYDSTAFALSAQDVGAPHRRKRIFVVAHPHGFNLRNEQQRVPARRARGVRHQGEAEPLHDGRSGLAPNTDGQGELRERGSGDGRGGRARNGAPTPRDGWPAQSPIRGVAHGVPDWLERIGALGNAVVPQCAEVIGNVIVHAWCSAA
jgi:DNA (cytosine-5)-methyltransferase 1